MAASKKIPMPHFDGLPMEAQSVAVLPKGKEWRYEPKWDGFRCLAYKKDGLITLRSKSNKPLDRYFPDIVEMLGKIDADDFILDGELVIQTDEGYSFSELQLRLHPAASRVKKLAEAHPAQFILFDFLKTAKRKDLANEPFAGRRGQLEDFYQRFATQEKCLVLSPQTESLAEAKKWIKKWRGQIDGLVAKNIEDGYCSGERVMQKFKFIRTADCVVGGFRYGTNSPLVGSLLLGLFDDEGLLHHVGFTSGLAEEDKPALTKKLEKLIGEPGFTGKAPGAPSRWSSERSVEWQPLKTKLVV